MKSLIFVIIGSSLVVIGAFGLLVSNYSLTIVGLGYILQAYSLYLQKKENEEKSTD